MDTRFWGPSAWQLFHLIAFRSPRPQELLHQIQAILPCKYCRESTAKFVHDHPLRGNPGKWLYDIHNLVNHKLRTQSEDDPTVIRPDEDPEFDDIKKQYEDMKPTAVPGRDFLFSIAFNYPDEPEEEHIQTQRKFISSLAKVYPFANLQPVFARYVQTHEPALQSRKAYMKWMYGLLKQLSSEINVHIPSFRGYAHHVAYYKSGCTKKTYHGKTCRKLTGGGRTKDRDHRKTYRVSHKNLI